MRQLKFFIKKLASSMIGYRRRTKSGKNPMPYDGSLFDRFSGLEFILPKSNGCTILDFGSCDGLISYEFARNKAKLIHGFDFDAPRVKFASTLFRNVPIESKFVQADLAINGEMFERKFSEILLEKYDIVLFLGIFHHLKNQMLLKDLHNLTNHLLDKTEKWFVVRSNSLPEFEELILARNFKLVHENRSKEVGLLRIYEKTKCS